MIDHIHRFTIPAAYSLVPESMRSGNATAMLLAIGLQESQFQERKQINGPARSFWQFELIAVKEVMRHPRTKRYAEAVIDALCYRLTFHSPTQQASAIHLAMEDNDPLACAFARLKLWTLEMPLPGPEDLSTAFHQYLSVWRPGAFSRGTDDQRTTLRATWNHHYAEAWQRISAATPMT